MSNHKKSPAFYCPDCGKKHRADLSGLKDKPGALLRVTCAGCELPLAVGLGQDGRPFCLHDEVPAAAAEPPPAAESPPAPEKAPTPKKAAASRKAPAPRSKRKAGKAERAAADKPKPETEPAAPGEAIPDKAIPDKAIPDKAIPDKAIPDKAIPDKTTPSKASPSKAAAKEAKAPAAEKQDQAPEMPDIEGEFGEGELVGRYTVEKAIGQGGCSTVYRAFDPTTNRSVALKVLAKDAQETIRNRFLREIEVQANIRHQNIMPVFDRGALKDGRPFFTMELLYKPWTLAQILEARDEGRLARYTTLKDLAEIETLVRDVIIPVSDGIYVANVENGVIHRDLKPDNVLVDSRTLRPYVIDFGICHVLERKAGFASKAVIAPTTEDEGIVGTPRFLAPEQVRGSVHARTDVWGLGATLHNVVAGEPPIANASNISHPELKRRIEALQKTKQTAIEKDDERKIEMCDEMLARLTDPSLRTVDDLFKDAKAGTYSELPSTTPAGLRAVILKAMAPATADRYVNARQMNTDLQAWLGGSRVRALAEFGGKAAAVESARRAVRTHAVTTLWLVIGLLAGLAIAYGIATPGAAPPSTRVADAEEDIRLLKGAAESLREVADDLGAVERKRLWTALDRRAQQILDRLAEEPDVPEVRARRERLEFERSRFQPARVRFEMPASVKLRATDLVSREAVTLKPGENLLPPGAYSVYTASGLRFPIEVPLVIRTDKQAERVVTEPAREVFSLPMGLSLVPKNMALVLGGRILARDLPFNPPSTSASDVAAFLMDSTEVSNGAYAAFLATLPTAERLVRGPQVAFIPDPEHEGAPMVIPGREKAPVVGIRAEDAMAYAAWRSKQEGASYRLPTEAEWVLAAGAALGHGLANGAKGLRTEAEFLAPLRNVGEHQKDVSPYGVRGLLGNAREMVTAYIPDLEKGSVLVKGAAVGDDPDQGAIYIHRVLKAGERSSKVGFRCMREIPKTEEPQ